MDKFTVRNSVDGSIDLNASTANYRNALAKFMAENEISTETIQNAVDAVFNEHPSVDAKTPMRITIPVLVSYVMGKIDHKPAQYAAIEARVKAFLKGSPRFDSSKGKGGGVSRVSLVAEVLEQKSA